MVSYESEMFTKLMKPLINHQATEHKSS